MIPTPDAVVRRTVEPAGWTLWFSFPYECIIVTTDKPASGWNPLGGWDAA